MDIRLLFLCILIPVNGSSVLAFHMEQTQSRGPSYCKRDRIFLQWMVGVDELLWRIIYLPTGPVSAVSYAITCTLESLHNLGTSVHTMMYNLGTSVHTMMYNLGTSVHTMMYNLGTSVHTMMYNLGTSVHTMMYNLGTSVHTMMYCLLCSVLYSASGLTS